MVEIQNEPDVFKPEDELSPEEIEECKQLAQEELKYNEAYDMELNLMKDDNRVPNQEWAVVSFVGPQMPQKCKTFGMKLMGCFESQQDARDYCARLTKIDDTFDKYVVEMYSWLALPPDPDLIKDQVHADEKLNELIVGHKEAQEEAKQMYNKRKDKLMTNPDLNKIKNERGEIDERIPEGPESEKKVIDDFIKGPDASELPQPSFGTDPDKISNPSELFDSMLGDNNIKTSSQLDT